MCVSSMCTVGWLRLVGSLKLQVSFAEYHLLYGALLQKRLVILRSLLIIATPEYKSKSTCVCVLNMYYGCLRLVGSLKLQVSVAEYSLFYRALLQMRPIILRSLLIVATPQYKSKSTRSTSVLVLVLVHIEDTHTHFTTIYCL